MRSISSRTSNAYSLRKRWIIVFTAPTLTCSVAAASSYEGGALLLATSKKGLEHLEHGGFFWGRVFLA